MRIINLRRSGATKQALCKDSICSDATLVVARLSSGAAGYCDKRPRAVAALLLLKLYHVCKSPAVANSLLNIAFLLVAPQIARVESGFRLAYRSINAQN